MRAAPQHATGHGHRGARGSNGSCSANCPGGCRIFTNYCCSVRVCTRGQFARPNLETTSGEKIPCVPISEIGTRDRDETPIFGGFSDLGNCENQRSSPHAVYTDITLGEYCRYRDLWLTSGYRKQLASLPSIFHMFQIVLLLFSQHFLRVLPSVATIYLREGWALMGYQVTSPIAYPMEYTLTARRGYSDHEATNNNTVQIPFMLYSSLRPIIYLGHGIFHPRGAVIISWSFCY